MLHDFAIPILPCRSLEDTVAFYGRLGFTAKTFGKASDSYAILRRGQLEIHFFLFPELRPADCYAGCYLRVSDVNQLHREFSTMELPSAGIPRITAIKNLPWGMREFALLDPNGNLLRIGQQMVFS